MLQLPSTIRIICVASAAILIAVPAFAVDNPAAKAERPSEPRAVNGEPLTVATIMNAWKQTAVKVRSAVFEWKEDRVQTKSLLADDESMAEPFTPQYGVTSRLSFAGNKIRYTFKKSSWVSEAPDGGDQYVGVFDGQDSKVYLPPGYVADHPRGHVSTKAESEELAACYLKPFLWCFRSNLPRVMLFEIGNAKLLPGSMKVEDHECLVLEYAGTPGQKHTIYVDPKQDFSIIRYATAIDDRLKFQFNIAYEHNAAHAVWVPKSWRYDSLDSSGNIQLSVIGTLLSHEINPVLPDGEFEFEFPVGTWVHDGRNTQYIVKADGPNRPVARSERSMPHSELVREPGLSPEATRWFFWCNLALLMAISGFLLFRWHQWKRAIPQ